MVKIALYQPDIPQNLGSVLRTAACFNADVEIIQPCGFPLDDKKLRRAGMDYIDNVNYNKHDSWEDFINWKKTANKRLLLLTTKASVPYYDISFKQDDVLMLGRESAGVPDDVHESCDERVFIPMSENMRSLNVAISAAIVLSEAIRQFGGIK